MTQEKIQTGTTAGAFLSVQGYAMLQEEQGKEGQRCLCIDAARVGRAQTERRAGSGERRRNARSARAREQASDWRPETPRSADPDSTEDRAGEAQRGSFATTFDDRSWFTALCT